MDAPMDLQEALYFADASFLFGFVWGAVAMWFAAVVLSVRRHCLGRELVELPDDERVI